jgi:hypothetical protein
LHPTKRNDDFPFSPARFDQRNGAEDTARFFTAPSGLKTMRIIKTTSIDNESGENT